DQRQDPSARRQSIFFAYISIVGSLEDFWMDYQTRTKVSRILTDDAVPVGSNVIILGWVRTTRSSKDVAFIEVNDGSCMKNIQGVVQNPAAFPLLEKISTGASVRMEGQLVTSAGKGQKY